jgi:hypothetical protein
MPLCHDVFLCGIGGSCFNIFKPINPEDCIKPLN